MTLCGGEPFAPGGGARRACKAAAGKNGYEVAAYSGYTFEELLDGTPEQRELLNNIDVLIDRAVFAGGAHPGGALPGKP